MKKFQQLLSQESPNEYGLQYRTIKPTKNLLKNIQNSYESRSCENPQTVQVYFKSDQNRSLKMKLSKKSKLQKIKQTIEERLLIPFQDQLIYLNGKEISVYSSITLNERQIIHITDRRNIAGLHEPVLVSLKVYAPNEKSFNGKSFCFTLAGEDKIFVLKSLLLNQDDFSGFGGQFEFNFLESGRMLNKEESFTENLITKRCEITCLLSENEVETKFVNECQQNSPEEEISYKRIESPKKLHKNNSQSKEQQFQNQGLKFNKPRSTSNKFLVEKGKSPIYTKIQNHENDHYSRRNQPKRKSESDMNAAFSGSGFKKKKSYHDQYDTADSHLIKKIKVHKSREEIERIASESSLITQEPNEPEEEKKSVVSSSSSDQNDKQYIPIRQQKQYRPCPLIPQRKMAQSEKIKINLELQKLFGIGQDSKMNLLSMNQPENHESTSETQQQTTRSRVINKNPGMRNDMRNSIGSKESFLRIVKDRKPNNRYAEQNMYEED